MKMLEIPEDLLNEVVTVLNRGIGLATRFEPSMVKDMVDTATKLDEAINDALSPE